MRAGTPSVWPQPGTSSSPGAVDWVCVRRLDAPSEFGSILGRRARASECAAAVRLIDHLGGHPLLDKTCCRLSLLAGELISACRAGNAPRVRLPGSFVAANSCR